MAGSSFARISCLRRWRGYEAAVASGSNHVAMFQSLVSSSIPYLSKYHKRKISKKGFFHIIFVLKFAAGKLFQKARYLPPRPPVPTFRPVPYKRLLRSPLLSIHGPIKKSGYVHSLHYLSHPLDVRYPPPGTHAVRPLRNRNINDPNAANTQILCHGHRKVPASQDNLDKLHMTCITDFQSSANRPPLLRTANSSPSSIHCIQVNFPRQPPNAEPRYGPHLHL